MSLGPGKITPGQKKAGSGGKNGNFKTSDLQILCFHLGILSSLHPFLPTSMLKIPQLQSEPDRLKSPGTLVRAGDANHSELEAFLIERLLKRSHCPAQMAAGATVPGRTRASGAGRCSASEKPPFLPNAVSTTHLMTANSQAPGTAPGTAAPRSSSQRRGTVEPPPSCRRRNAAWGGD